MPETPDRTAEFIKAGCAPLDSGHSCGTLEEAEAIRAADPGLARQSIYASAVLGDAEAVRRFLAADPGQATAKGGPYDWDPLTYLCFSRYLRLDPARSAGFVRAAEALLDAGADANTGFFSPDHQPRPQFESVLYGATGVAHHAALTRLLLERGADPNDGEVAYHAPETSDNAALKLLVQSGKLNDESLATILLRKADWHDHQAVQWLLEQGVNPNLISGWDKTALQQAVLRDNALATIELLLDHGADPLLTPPAANSRSAPVGSVSSLAARRGRGDVLELLERRGCGIQAEGVERLIGACARNDQPGIALLRERQPELVNQLRAEGGKLLAQFAGNGNLEGVRRLLELGAPVDALFEEGEGYFDVAQRSTALHVAAWRARHEVVRLLIQSGAPVNALDGQGRTPLALAVRACVDSYWTQRRAPDSVRLLLEAGAGVSGARFPSGYAEVDELLRRYGVAG